ncbi:UNVERIFIED_ORG: polysaccharide export outer membrane protein [Methylobacterium sp. SuP10 SLI 274]|uniref:polysaccharide biosynthesis/export family protein n=1 Tax=Methylorubrum extorquens TaxID=408 RepID=UPI001AE35F68|nr:polysaccharide biosynthesis/export family protein [Methylorubrum extorquens]MDF9861315.1 polysaccharide export outer membrane protein [Methylorubrum pseudosasae]MDH6634943.1 polysaccharide export outer membrane protein [Methylobacterium sp. SuP10 SLI 274]MDH6664112.1 polysaccharide export outer membrane protein [Methylorubrum zatmanii]MCP1561118.1 polysaccharide export outer membrane protein [Methylorubrum extorquens]MDF9789598.1 polysaccharide export outer membrane protein [Methylorubrum e
MSDRVLPEPGVELEEAKMSMMVRSGRFGSGNAASTRRRGGRFVPRASAWAILVLIGVSAAPLRAAEEYRLQSGDVLEFSVSGIPDLRQRLPVTIDGTVSIPLVGDIPARGETLADIRAAIRETLPKTSLNMRTANGGEQQTVIGPNEITLVIADYRPVYILGDVSKPGEVRYAPGLSVRQAVSLAGGYDLQRFRMENPILESADLRSEYESLWVELAQGLATLARLRAELTGAAALDQRKIENTPIPASVEHQIWQNEQDLFKVRGENYKKELAHLQKTERLAGERLTAIQDQYRRESEAAKFDFDEIERINDLNKRGVVPLTRAVETRRLSLTTATRALQIGVEVEKSKRDLLDAERSIVRLGDQQRADLTRELQEASVKLAQTRTKLSATGEKLLYTGVVRSQLVRGSGGKPTIVLHRKDGAQAKVSQVDENEALQPGDTLEIALKVEHSLTPSAN